MLVLPYGLQRAYDSYFVWVSANIPSPYSYCTPRMQFHTNYQAPWKKSGHRFRHKNITNHIGRIVVKSNKLDLTTPRSQSSPHIFKEWYLITHIHFIFKINIKKNLQPLFPFMYHLIWITTQSNQYRFLRLHIRHAHFMSLIFYEIIRL